MKLKTPSDVDYNYPPKIELDDIGIEIKFRTEHHGEYDRDLPIEEATFQASVLMIMRVAFQPAAPVNALNIALRTREFDARDRLQTYSAMADLFELAAQKWRDAATTHEGERLLSEKFLSWPKPSDYKE